MSEQILKLGQAPGSGARRDAAHVAVLPIQAGQRLLPGQSVRVMDGRAWGSSTDVRHGITDPFLKDAVETGGMVYVLLNPGSIVGLRHAWVHPEIDEELSGRPVLGGGMRISRPQREYERPDQKEAFERELKADPYDVATRNAYADWLLDAGDDALANRILDWSPEKQKSLDWMGEFSEKMELSYDGLMRAAEGWLETGEPYVLPFDTPREAYTEAEEFWEHYRTVTGVDVEKGKRRAFFTCSC